MDKNLAVFLPIAFVAGYIGLKLKIPAGGIVFAMLAVASVKLLYRVDNIPVPFLLSLIPQAIVGLVLGSQFSRSTIQELSRVSGYIFVSVIVLFVTGLVLGTIFMRMRIMNPPTAYISTSPGAITGMIFMAIDMKEVNAPIVAVFHLVRMSFILLTGPIVLKLIQYLKVSP